MAKKKKIKAVKKVVKKNCKNCKNCKKSLKECIREKVSEFKPLPDPYYPPLVFKKDNLWRRFLRLIGYIP